MKNVLINIVEVFIDIIVNKQKSIEQLQNTKKHISTQIRKRINSK